MAPSQTSDAAQHRCQSNAYAYASGPKLPLVGLSDAAPQLRQTGHSCIVQHVLEPNDRNADLPAVRCKCCLCPAVRRLCAGSG